ncbi:MAG: EamA family transporter [Nocardioidaceae bacterium]
MAHIPPADGASLSEQLRRGRGWRISSGALLVVAGAALFGTIGTARLLGPEAPAISVGVVRLLLAAAVLIALAWTHGRQQLFAAWCLPAVWVAGVSQAAFNVTFFGAVTRAGVAIGTLVAIGCTPILTGLLARRFPPGWLAATSLALAGLVALLSGGFDHGVTVSGLLFALGASASYSGYILSSAALARSSLEMDSKLAAIFTVAALCLTPGLLLYPLDWAATGGGIAMAAYLGVPATVLAYHLFNRGLRLIEPGPAATLALTEPLVAALLGVVVLGERLTPLSWLGAATVLAALVVMIVVSRTPPQVVDNQAGEHSTSSDSV